MDRKSGMLYNETVGKGIVRFFRCSFFFLRAFVASGLYFDPQTQQFISMWAVLCNARKQSDGRHLFFSRSGIYYMKGISPENVLVRSLSSTISQKALLTSYDNCFQVPVSRMTAPGFTFQKSNQPLPTEFTLPWADSIRDEIATIDQASGLSSSDCFSLGQSRCLYCRHSSIPKYGFVQVRNIY